MRRGNREPLVLSGERLEAEVGRAGDDGDLSDRIAFSVEEAASVAGFSRAKVYEFLQSGLLRGKKADGRTLILRDDLVAFLKALPDYQRTVSQKTSERVEQ